MNANNAKVKAVFLFLPTFLSLNNVEQTFQESSLIIFDKKWLIVSVKRNFR